MYLEQNTAGRPQGELEEPRQRPEHATGLEGHLSVHELHEDRLACTVAAPIRSRRNVLSLSCSSVVPNQHHWGHQGLVSVQNPQAPLPTYSIKPIFN